MREIIILRCTILLSYDIFTVNLFKREKHYLYLFHYENPLHLYFSILFFKNISFRKTMLKQRTVYSELEKQIFLEILKKYKHVIESKDTNSSTLKEKSEAWSIIIEKYNNSSLISTKVLNYISITLYFFQLDSIH